MAHIPAYFDFLWHVPSDGFEWHRLSPEREARSRGLLTAESSPEQMDTLELGLLPKPTGGVRSYQPLKDYTGLFVTFSAVEITPPAILAFANQYGTLEASGIRDSLAPPRRGEAWRGDSLKFPYGVSWQRDWQAEIESMRELLERYGFRDGTFTGMKPSSDPEDIDIGGDSAFLWDRKFEVHRQLTLRLPGHVTFTIQDDTLQYLPTTLLGAIWLQFWLAVAQRKEYRRCEAPECPRTWFEISKAPFGLRPEARYCSTACRSRAWLSRKAPKE